MSPSHHLYFPAQQLRGVHQPDLRDGVLREAGAGQDGRGACEGGDGEGGRVGSHLLPDD